MSTNPIPEPIRRQAWNLLRPYKDVKITIVGPTLEWVLNRVLGYDRGA